MVETKGLRVGQAPGAVAEDGGQSILTTYGIYSVFLKCQTVNKEDAMKYDDLVKGGCGRSAEDVLFSAKVCAFCLIVMALSVATVAVLAMIR